MSLDNYSYDIKGNGKSITITLKMPFKEGIDLHGELEPAFQDWYESKDSELDMTLSDAVQYYSHKLTLDDIEHRLEVLENKVIELDAPKDLPM